MYLFCAAGFLENLAQVQKGSIEVPGKNSVLLFVSTVVRLMITSPEYQDLRLSFPQTIHNSLNLNLFNEAQHHFHQET